MADQYMWAWMDRSRRVAILRVRGELDAVWQSRDLLLETSGVMARLATTYAEMAAARDRRAVLEPAKADYLRVLSGAARDLSTYYRQHAMAAGSPPSSFRPG